MKKLIENLAIGKLIFNAFLIWFGGWFIFLVIEVIMRLIKYSSPWPLMMLFTLLLYSGVGIAAGGVLAGVIALLLKVIKRLQKRIEALPLIMSCCIIIITLLYTGLFIHDQLLPLYPHLPPFFINLALIPLGLILLSTLYMILARIADKTRLITAYLALSLILYTLMIIGLYINENLLSGKFFDLDAARIITNSGILIGSVILYLMIYSIFIFMGKRVLKTLKSIPFNTPLVASILIVIGGVTLYMGMRSTLKTLPIMPNEMVKDKPHIILITMDTTRADHLSCYGYHKNTTPHLDKLAREGVVFKNVYASSPWTLPSHASIFTSMYPARHGAHCDWEIMKSNWPIKLSKHYKILAEILADDSFRTAGVIGAPVLNSFFGLAQGFEYYDDALINVIPDLKHFTLFRILNRWTSLKDIAAQKGLNGSRVASQINRLVFSWLEKHYQSPFFLFINYFDPHHPYLPPDKYSLLFREEENPEITASERHKRDLLARYDGEIAYLDYHMGKLFEKLKGLNIYHSSLIIITSDHGEFFGEHDFWGHCHELYQEVLKIPLIIKYPSSCPQKGIYLKRVSLVDIMPTILNFLKLPLPQHLQGANLFNGRTRVMAEVYRHEYPKTRQGDKFARELKTLFLDNYKYIKELKGRGELYDIDNDPQELYNLIDKMPGKAEEMGMKLMEWLPYDQSQISAGQPVKFDKSIAENLRALGYIK